MQTGAKGVGMKAKLVSYTLETLPRISDERTAALKAQSDALVPRSITVTYHPSTQRRGTMRLGSGVRCTGL